ncbi:MAG: class I SAM-dependent methyltransferase, partial [Anaerolineae bacterium]|nr:class I SAM-dependent methyltransferase [Anaerolineae bacterium]
MNHPVTRHAYDCLGAHYSERDYCPMERETDRFVGLVSYGGWVPDLGCGPGRCARVLLMSGIRVVGLDPSL